MNYVTFIAVLTIVIVAAIAAREDREMTTYPVTIIMDEEYAEREGDTLSPYEEATELVNTVSDYFEARFKIRFEVANDEELIYQSPPLQPLEEGWMDLAGAQILIDEAAYILPSDGTIVIVFTGTNMERRNPGISLTTERRGFKEYYALIWADSENPRNVLIHEIAHLFGAKHPWEGWGEEYMNEHPSIMNPVEVFTVDEFDPKNEEILREGHLDLKAPAADATRGLNHYYWSLLKNHLLVDLKIKRLFKVQPVKAKDFISN